MVVNTLSSVFFYLDKFKSFFVIFVLAKSIYMKLLDFVYIIVASQGFLLSLFLLLKKNKAIHLPLVVFLFLTSIDFAFQFLHASGIILHYPHLIYSNEPFTVLRGVLLFMYVRNSYYGKIIYWKTDILFLIPFVLYVIYYFDFYVLSVDHKVNEYQVFVKEGIAMVENLLEWIFEILVTIPFIIAAVVLLKKTEIKVKKEFSDITSFNYVLARNLLLGVVVVYLFEIATIVLCYFGFEYGELCNVISYCIAAILLYLLGYDALIREHNLIFLKQSASNEVKSNFEIEDQVVYVQEKYKKNNLSTNQIELIGRKLIQAMEVDKLYRNPDIRLTILAEALGENSNNVSQVINQLFQQNFYDFINTYRIQDAKEKLKSPLNNHLTIEAIGQEVGFKSKSTFYTSFKKYTSVTPVDFKKIS